MLSLDLANWRKTLLATALILAFLFSSTAIAQFVRFASAQSINVSITADGTIYPSTAPVKRFGDLYILTGDTGQIFVGKSNITLDGSGHTIQGAAFNSQTSNIGGISLTGVQNVTVRGFSIKDCEFGIALDNCSNVIISCNNISVICHPITQNMYAAAIFMWHSNHNVITGNRLENNEYGIAVGEYCVDNVFVGNTVSDSTKEGVTLLESSGNTFYHNNFDNKQNVYDSSLSPYSSASLSINAWDNGEEGNFWSDYNGTDADGDGVGDTPHWLYSMNQDNYPLMKPWEPEISDTTPPSISIASPENTTYTENRVLLNFFTNEPCSWLGYSLDGQEIVTVMSNTTITNLSNGMHNIKVFATDTFGNTGTSETVSFTVTVPEPFPTMTIAVVSVATVAVAGVGLLVCFRKRNR